MIIIHGDNQIKSRDLYLQVKDEINKSGKNVVDKSSDVSISDLVTAVESSSLFGQSNSVFLENVFSARPSNAKKELVEFLKTHQQEDITIWENKDVTAQLKDFDPKLIKNLELPKTIFAFLNHPTPSNLRSCLTSMPVEQAFASLVTRLYKQQQTSKLLALLDLDYQHKTSQLPYDLTTGLELFLFINFQ